MKSVTCESGVRQLMDYLEGTLPGEVRVALEGHVAGCALCRAFIESYRATPRILREASDIAPTPEQQQMLLALLRSRRRA